MKSRTMSRSQRALTFAGDAGARRRADPRRLWQKSSTRPNPPSSTGSLSGKVTIVASAGSPVAGATVTASSGAATTTDASGQFTLTLPSGTDVRVDVTKTGFTLNQLHVQLAAKRNSHGHRRTDGGGKHRGGRGGRRR